MKRINRAFSAIALLSAIISCQGNQPALQEDPHFTQADTSSHLLVLKPHYDSVAFVCRADINGCVPDPFNFPDAVLCCSASFTKTGTIGAFGHDQIWGPHIVADTTYYGHRHYSGYLDDHYRGQIGYFYWRNDAQAIKPYKGQNGSYQYRSSHLHFCHGSFPDWIDEGCACGFSQLMVVDSRMPAPLCRNDRNMFRALCMVENEMVIMQNTYPMLYRDFVDSLIRNRVDNALYLDMGGWDYCWYRDDQGQPHWVGRANGGGNLTNWIVFF